MDVECYGGAGTFLLHVCHVGPGDGNVDVNGDGDDNCYGTGTGTGGW